MQKRKGIDGIQIFSQETIDRLNILQSLSEGALKNAEAIKTIADKLDGFKAEIHIKDCSFRSGNVAGSLITLNGNANSSVSSCIMQSGVADDDYDADDEDEEIENDFYGND